MNNKIKLVFTKNQELICLSDMIIHYLHIQNFDLALRMTTSFINDLSIQLEVLLSEPSYFNEEVNVINNQFINDMLNSILQAIDNRDYVLIADLYEIHLIPFLLRVQETIAAKEYLQFDDIKYKENLDTLRIENMAEDFETLPDPVAFMELGYHMEYTSCGLMTLAIGNNEKRYYMHSNYRIQKEAFTLANSWYREDTYDYIIYGLGLGYHIKALSEIDECICIKVYESDMNIIKLACMFTDLGVFLNKSNIELVYDPDFTKLFQQLQDLPDTSKFLIHYPSLRNIKDTAIREKLENYFLQYSSIENQRKLLNANFRENIHHYDALADELRDTFYNKDLYIVAAGPSLDKNYQQLVNIDRSNSIILATGTVFRKLLNAGIIPDYVIVTDANARVYGQIAGYENSNVPMLYLSSAYKGFAQNYKGRKYMICQQDYDKSEEFAKEHGTMLFQTGGSVSTTALDIGIAFGCKRIIFLGLDLAFTDNYVHAEQTSRRDLASTEDLRQVTDIYGKQVYTSKSLDIYRQWIENRIRDVKEIEFIDATEGGARIDGMKIKKLAECITR